MRCPHRRRRHYGTPRLGHQRLPRHRPCHDPFNVPWLVSSPLRSTPRTACSTTSTTTPPSSRSTLPWPLSSPVSCTSPTSCHDRCQACRQAHRIQRTPRPASGRTSSSGAVSSCPWRPWFCLGRYSCALFQGKTTMWEGVPERRFRLPLLPPHVRRRYAGGYADCLLRRYQDDQGRARKFTLPRRPAISSSRARAATFPAS